MLNYIWAFMIMIGVIYGAMTGNMREVSNAEFRRRGGLFVYHDDGCNGVVGGADGDRPDFRADCEADKGDPAFCVVYVSRDS